MATALAVELAANCAALPDRPAGNARHGLAQNQRRGTFAQRSWAVSVHLQPRYDGGPRPGSAGAARKIPNQNGDRHGRRTTAGMASSTTWNGPVNSLDPSAQVCAVVLFFNVFSMPQKSGFRRSFMFAGEMMDQGSSLLVFPEGQRTKHGALNPFHARHGFVNRN